jgi:energy-coupling factor transporter ATP-binding protein EcfA2
MSNRRYTASRVRDPGRERFSVIFRHPVRLDGNGKPGRRVRRGLGTSDPDEADRIVAEIDTLLGNEEYWSPTARPVAEDRFDARAVAAFFDGLEPVPAGSSVALRDQAIPLPSSAEGYRQVLLLGTTGAGKTTLVRQLLGTHPEVDRFPSTSTAKTTIADTELVISEGKYRAVVTFSRRDEVIDHLVDCASKAAAAVLRGDDDPDVVRALLDHENQRFRFSYVLGRHYQNRVTGLEPLLVAPSFEEDETEETGFEAEPEGLPGIDLTATKRVVDEALATLKELVAEQADKGQAALGVDGDEETRIAQDLIEEQLDRNLRDEERFNAIVDSLVDEIEKRFDALTPGRLTRDQQGWPTTWAFESEDRTEFLRAVNRFSSNYAPRFGHLLSPLVDGIRAAGPFVPDWADGALPPLVLIDGEGLGHTAKSAVALPTEVAQRIDNVDAILLVDNATQPMQATPASAVTSILTSGHASKLVFCFTHFDEVRGDNLGTASDRAQHVLSSVENFLSSIGEEFQQRAEREIRSRLASHCFFLADIDKPLRDDTPAGRQSINQMRKMVAAIEAITEKPELGPARPVYDKANLVLAITAATASFHRRWHAVLGLSSEVDVDKEHWTRVKALNRRFAEESADRYDTLRPVSDLKELLQREIYKTLDSPMDWKGGIRPDAEAATAAINEFSQAVSRRLFAPLAERLRARPLKEWQEGYRLTGWGSTSVRSRLIANDVFARQVPIPRATPSLNHNDFLHSVIDTIEGAAAEVGVTLN